MPRAELLLAPATPAERWPGLVANFWPLAPERPTCLVAPLSGDAELVGRFGLNPEDDPRVWEARIASTIADRHGILIGSRTAEFLRMGIGNANGEALTMDVRGREAADQTRERVATITSQEVEAARGSGRALARRATGGQTLRAGDGCIAIALALPRTGALLQGGVDVPPNKIVNRFVRPVLGALAAHGLPAAYFGRDFISSHSTAVASVGWDALHAGPSLFECIVAFERPLRDAPPWAVAGIARPHDFCQSLRRGFSERLSVELSEAQPAPAPREPAWPLVEHLPSGRAERAIAIGTLVAFADAMSAGDSTPRLTRAALRGDFQADAESLAALEQSLAGCPAEYAEIGRRVDAAFGPRGRGAIVGLASLQPMAEALLEAAGAQIG